MYEEPKIISKLGRVMRRNIPKAGEDLELYIRSLDSLKFELAESTANQKRLLYEKRKQMLWPKDSEKGLTELDRSVRLNGDLAILERDMWFLERLNELVEQRLTLCIIFLN